MSEGLVCALMIGRAGSRGFPGKNVAPLLGRPMAAYPLRAATAARTVDRLFVSTDSPEIVAIAEDYRAQCIERPAALATSAALGEDVFAHGYGEIARRLATEGKRVELMVLLFANAPTLTAEMIDEGVSVLRKDPSLDSAVTTSVYNMWSPLRARKIGADGCLVPFVPFETFGDPKTLNCDRDSQGEVHFADMGLSVVRPRCLEHLSDGLLPQKWMGQRIHPIRSEGGCDVDYAWQMPMVEHWLRAHGVTEQ